MNEFARRTQWTSRIGYQMHDADAPLVTPSTVAPQAEIDFALDADGRMIMVKRTRQGNWAAAGVAAAHSASQQTKCVKHGKARQHGAFVASATVGVAANPWLAKVVEPRWTGAGALPVTKVEASQPVVDARQAKLRQEALIERMTARKEFLRTFQRS